MSHVLVNKEKIFNLIDKVNQMQIEIAELNNELMALYGQVAYGDAKNPYSNPDNSASNKPFDFVKVISYDKGNT